MSRPWLDTWRQRCAILLSIDASFSRRFLLGNALIFLVTALGLVFPYLLKLVVDAMLARAPFEHLLVLGGIGVAFFILQFILGVARRFLISKTAERAHAHLRVELLSRALGANLLALKRQTPGHLATLVELDSRTILSLPESLFPSFATLSTLLVGTACVLFWLEPTLFLLVLVPLPVILILGAMFRRSIRERSLGAQNARGAIVSSLFETFAGIESIKVYGGEDTLTSQIHARGEDVLEHNVALITQRAWLFPVLNLSLSIAMLATLIAGGYFVLQDTTSAGVVIAFYIYLSRLLAPIRGATELLYGWHRYRASEDRIQSFLREATPLPSPKSPRVLPEHPGEIVIDGVSFAYGEEPVLEDLSLVIEPGAWIAILGPSGAGKSTLGKLVPRLFDPNSGEIHIAGVPLTEVDPIALRRRIGYIGQEVLLFEGTLRENILFGLRREVSEEELARVLDMAQVTPIIEAREEGLDDRVGQGAGNLSGGQKKRIALARALLRQPDLIVIDQLASDLEASLNEKIFGQLASAFHGSILYLGHRVPDGFTASQVYWLEGGQLAPRDVLQ